MNERDLGVARGGVKWRQRTLGNGNIFTWLKKPSGRNRNKTLIRQKKKKKAKEVASLTQELSAMRLRRRHANRCCHDS